MQKPLVSVIIPAHNGALYLADAIQSILHQTYAPIEILVIDNGSQDGTSMVAQSFPQVRYIRMEEANTAAARNCGVALAKGAFLSFLDQDDLWESEKVEKQLAYLEEHPAIHAVVCMQTVSLYPGYQKPHWLKQEFLETAQCAYLPSALLIRQEVFSQTNLFDTNYSLTSDVAWFFKAKALKLEVALLNEPLIIRRIHDQNASNHCREIQREILTIIRASLNEKRKNGMISVILTVYNGEKYVKEAIESILSQTYQNKEVIVVNDGSTDSTQTILEQFGSSIQIVYQENRGLGSARNTGIRLAKGTYLAFLDHDDIWGADALSSQMAQMDETDPLIFSHVKQFICPTLDPIEQKKLHVDERTLPAYFAGTLLVSKERFLQVGYFFEKNTVGEFVDWYARALEKQLPVRMQPTLTLFRRVHMQNMGRQKERYDRMEYLKILKNSLDRRRSSHAAPP